MLCIRMLKSVIHKRKVNGTKKREIDHKIFIKMWFDVYKLHLSAVQANDKVENREI